jgi:hypothetical protein
LINPFPAAISSLTLPVRSLTFAPKNFHGTPQKNPPQCQGKLTVTSRRPQASIYAFLTTEGAAPFAFPEQRVRV